MTTVGITRYTEYVIFLKNASVCYLDYFKLHVKFKELKLAIQWGIRDFQRRSLSYYLA